MSSFKSFVRRGAVNQNISGDRLFIATPSSNHLLYWELDEVRHTAAGICVSSPEWIEIGNLCTNEPPLHYAYKDMNVVCGWRASREERNLTWEPIYHCLLVRQKGQRCVQALTVFFELHISGSRPLKNQDHLSWATVRMFKAQSCTLCMFSIKRTIPLLSLPALPINGIYESEWWRGLIQTNSFGEGAICSHIQSRSIGRYMLCRVCDSGPAAIG